MRAFRGLALVAVLCVLFSPRTVFAQQGLYQQSPSSTATPTPSPTPTLTPGTQPFKYVVYVIQENRSVDNLMQGVPGATVSTLGYNHLGVSVTATPVPYLGGEPDDPTHTHANWITDCNPLSGALLCGSTGHNQADGWDLSSGCGAWTVCPYFYVQENSGTCGGGSTCTNVIHYINAAENYTLSDMSFQANEGPSFTAHQFLLAGQSGYGTGTTGTGGGCPSAHCGTVNQSSKGCDGTVANNSLDIIDMTSTWPGSVINNGWGPCLDYSTVLDEVNAAGLTWRYYAAAGTTGDSQSDQLWDVPRNVSHLCLPLVSGNCSYPATYGGTVSKPETNFLTDLAGCSLANLSVITPSVQNSDHTNTATNGNGPTWVQSIVNGIGNSTCTGSGPNWNNTLILVTWDDWGGQWDHVQITHPAERPSSPNEVGFRVPVLVISAYNTTPGAVDHTVRDAAGSLIHTIRTALRLPNDPQCSGTSPFTISGYFQPATPPPNNTGGLCQDDLYSISPDLFNNLTTTNAPRTFVPIALTQYETTKMLAGTSDNGAALLHSPNPFEREQGLLALQYAQEKWGDRRLAHVDGPVDY